MSKNITKTKTPSELAKYFNISYSDLADIIYKTDNEHKYKKFTIPKKNGGIRTINAPTRKLKQIQKKLAEELYKIYPGKPASHGFAKGKSIVTNAEMHLDKKYVFNIDLEGFFDSIHFGRVKYLLQAEPYCFDEKIATIIAHICCLNNKLPQGAPTSPIISNMIAYKLDCNLQNLAKKTNCTYTRYADDITFSFTCKKSKISREIAAFGEDGISVGTTLKEIIKNNGFEINFSKVRFRDRNSRLEVTGLTVNEFVNVPRTYVKQISAMLHSWRKHGYAKSESEHNTQYNLTKDIVERPKNYLHVIKGKLAFLHSVRGGRDPIFQKLAKQFNELTDKNNHFRIITTTDPEKNAIESLWVIECGYDSDGEEFPTISQGTGFDLSNIGIITCAHVVSENNKVLEHIEAYKYNSHKKYKISVDKIDFHRDIAICSLENFDQNTPRKTINKSENEVEIKQDILLMGFPGHSAGHSPYLVDANVARIYPQSGISKFEISTQIRGGNSGGPVLDSDSNVIGIATEGAYEDGGHNGCVTINEVFNLLNQ